MNSPPVAGESREAGFMQPGDHLLANPCMADLYAAGICCIQINFKVISRLLVGNLTMTNLQYVPPQSFNIGIIFTPLAEVHWKICCLRAKHYVVRGTDA